MARRDEEFTVSIPVEGEDQPLRGKFRIKLKLSMAEMLSMDALRRQLLGPSPDGASTEAAVLAHAVSKIRTFALETPSWWKDAQDGLGFDDINVPLLILSELNKIEKTYLDGLTKKAEAAASELKAEVVK